ARLESRSRRLYGGGRWRSGPGNRDQQQRDVQRDLVWKPHGRALRGGVELFRERRQLANRQCALRRDGHGLLFGLLHHATRRPHSDDEYRRLESRSRRLHGGGRWWAGPGDRSEERRVGEEPRGGERRGGAGGRG